MKKVVYSFAVIISVVFLSACGESVEERAQHSLQSARMAYEAGDFQSAKIELDSLKIQARSSFLRYQGRRSRYIRRNSSRTHRNNKTPLQNRQ